MDAAEPRRHQFSTMGTFGELLLRAPEGVAEAAFDDAVAELARIQAAMTRFDPTSPIERLNDAGGGVPDEDLREVLVAADAAWHVTGGRFDIGVGRELIAAGYDRDFDLLEHAAPRAADEAEPAAQATATEVVHSWLDPPTPPFTFEPDGSVRVREGSRLDLGGIAKGWAADRVRMRLATHGSCLVNLGGDISVHVEPGDDPWPIGVELSPDDGPLTLALAYGGLATSGQDRRVWMAETGKAHHLIDPRTGRPSGSDVLRITVVGANCMEAEVWTKALLLAGSERACEEAERRGITAIVVGLDGRSHRTGALAGG
jgi:thiamine biosynthesis lipoprotein